MWVFLAPQRCQKHPHPPLHNQLHVPTQDQVALAVLLWIMTRTIGVRELRQAASEHLRAVAAGEEIIVTDRGHPVARLIASSPLEQRLAEALADHALIGPTRRRRDFTTSARLPGPSLSTMLDEDRDDRVAMAP